jgi:hypothetical protein
MPDAPLSGACVQANYEGCPVSRKGCLPPSLPICSPSPTIPTESGAGSELRSIFLLGELAVRTGKLRFGWVLAMALSASAFSTSASAYTPEQQQACTGDAMNLCGAYVPDVDRITACMIQNKARLSPGCRAHFRAGPEPVAATAPASRPMSIKPAAPRKAVSTKSSAKAKKPKKPAKPASS